MCEALSTEIADVVFGEIIVSAAHDPRHEFFAHAHVGHAHHLCTGDRRVLEQDLFDLAGIEVLTSADHEVLHAAHDVEVAIIIEHAEVTSVHKPVVVDRFGSCIWGFPNNRA